MVMGGEILTIAIAVYRMLGEGWKKGGKKGGCMPNEPQKPNATNSLHACMAS